MESNRMLDLLAGIPSLDLGCKLRQTATKSFCAMALVVYFPPKINSGTMEAK